MFPKVQSTDCTAPKGWLLKPGAQLIGMTISNHSMTSVALRGLPQAWKNFFWFSAR
jgi:hypothetical protein